MQENRVRHKALTKSSRDRDRRGESGTSLEKKTKGVEKMRDEDRAKGRKTWCGRDGYTMLVNSEAQAMGERFLIGRWKRDKDNDMYSCALKLSSGGHYEEGDFETRRVKAA